MTAVRVEIKEDIAWVIIQNPPVNATSLSVRQGLLKAVAKVQGCKLAVLKCEGRTFIAGGDMTEFDNPPQEPHLPDVLDAIENSETPFLAFMHGTVLGGGFETAIACTYRYAKPGTRFGLPEVNVGLIPGAGGTQRAPRLLGWDAAIQMACLGRIMSAEELLKIGGIDVITNDVEHSITALSEKRPIAVSQRSVENLPEEKWQDYHALIKKRARGQNAPENNLDALKWAVEPYSKGQPKERALHLELRQSEQSKALRHIFFAERAASSPQKIKGVTPKPIERIVIVGGGLMGSGIATACLNGDYQVAIIEQSKDAAQSAQSNVEKILQGGFERGKISSEELATRKEAFSTHSNYEVAANADLAIEAVFEDINAKREVFSRLQDVMKDDAILATNTSYLDPETIFENIENKARCVGLHFFSPAHIMKLLEVVELPITSKETLATAFQLAKKLRKMPVISGICDGFIGNRMLAAYRRAAEYLLADGAYPHEVDAAMRGFGMAMGPFETQDLSGLQIGYANRRRQDATRNKNERYITIADQLFEKDRLGRKSSKGWYAYGKSSKAPIVDDMVTSIIDDYRKQNSIAPKQFSQEDIQNLLMAAMVNEGALIVEEGIAENSASVDVVKVHGYGFPRYRGGPMQWAQSVGDDLIRNGLTRLEKASPNSWTRAERFR
jgi:3-hydroxyacyl-CoA dehydrogenase